MELMTSWEREGVKKGIVLGLKEGREKGKQEGKLEGKQEGKQEGWRDALIEVLEGRFGRLPVRTSERLASIGSTEELRALLRRASVAESLGELGL